MSAIDRLAPLKRPSGQPVMHPGWQKLLFLHWPVEPEQIQALLPDGLELDTFAGQAWVGLVPFTMTRVTPRWMPGVPVIRSLYENFHETNVRTYVHYKGEPGVWFFSLDAASGPAVGAARAWYKLPYFLARMNLTVQPDGTISYTSRRLAPGPLPANARIRAKPKPQVFHALPGSFEHFLAERYILYSQARHQLFRGRVHHVPYPLQWAEVTELSENLVAAAGITRPNTMPHALYAAGVEVDIFPLEPV
jgi:uncharacterized protein YqjF (DUF2071 family)